MNKTEIANRIQVDRKTINNWEKTKPELLRLVYLGLEAEKLLEKKRGEDLDLVEDLSIKYLIEEQNTIVERLQKITKLISQRIG
ncbi:MAG: hypothetical protein JXQ68_08010 [Campylobacterales bacterium]|nr:hypothetical protein [Campylobacterales bacterium]